MSKVAAAPKAVYESSDGKTFATAKQAENRNALIAAERQLSTAVKEVEACLGATALTADGKCFHVSGSETYYFVRPHWGDLPTVERVWIWAHHLSVDIDRGGTGAMVVREWRDKEYVTYRVNELYTTKAAADAACLAAAEKRVQEYQERLEAMKQKVD